MQILILENVLVGGVWHEPGVGEYSPELAEHLISLGVARPIQAKVEKPKMITKDEKKTLTSASLPDQASREKPAKKRKRSKR